MSLPEESAFVECGEEQKNLTFDDVKQQGRFELGVSMLVYGWDALDIAVVNQWGGPDSAEKRDWITGVVVSLFADNKIVDAALIEETLLYAMLDEFDTHVDDGTADPVANAVIKLYEECRNQDYTRVETLYTKWLERQKNGSANDKTRYVQVDEVSSDEEEDSDEEDECHDHEHDMDVDMHEDEAPALVQEPVIDDDGFELVQKKGRRRH